MKSETLRYVKRAKLSLCLIKHHIVNTYGAVHVRLQAFSILTLGKGELSASHSDRFTSRERACT